MTKDSARKKAVRAYLAAHPDLTYREAEKIVTAEHEATKAAEAADWMFSSIEELVSSSIAGDEQLLDRELDIDAGSGGAFEVDIPAITQGPIDIVAVTHDLDTLFVDEHEEFEGGTTIGEAQVDADVRWEARVLKAELPTVPHDVPWRVIDPDWDTDNVRVSGTFRAELVYHYVADEGAQLVDTLTLQGFEQL
ncbi:hypothetical protein V4F30_25960 [Rhodococcus sp. IITD102]|uniref:hypothetical protein n=1 Tax=Rhodococcus TaxID=1827 RepID=UPI0026F45B43|nr:hypothetical protein [Rhodococcus ruber]MDO2381010.1 hypothetical protein [Rhodococcus ruber]